MLLFFRSIHKFNNTRILECFFPPGCFIFKDLYINQFILAASLRELVSVPSYRLAKQ